MASTARSAFVLGSPVRSTTLWIRSCLINLGRLSHAKCRQGAINGRPALLSVMVGTKPRIVNARLLP
jgi:hypothetical protein